VLLDDQRAAGPIELSFDTRALPAGYYTVRLQTARGPFTTSLIHP